MFIANCRTDAIAYTTLLDDALSQSMQQTTQLCKLRDLDLDARLAAAQAMMQTWAGIAMQVGQLINKLSDEFGDRITGRENIPQYDTEEWQFVETVRADLLESFQLDVKAKKQGVK
jgi:hypothetical protein